MIVYVMKPPGEELRREILSQLYTAVTRCRLLQEHSEAAGEDGPALAASGYIVTLTNDPFNVCIIILLLCWRGEGGLLLPLLGSSDWETGPRRQWS